MIKGLHLLKLKNLTVNNEKHLTLVRNHLGDTEGGSLNPHDPLLSHPGVINDFQNRQILESFIFSIFYTIWWVH